MPYTSFVALFGVYSISAVGTANNGSSNADADQVASNLDI